MKSPADDERDLEAIEEAAANWIAQREEGFSVGQAQEFERWCRADRRQAAAVARLEQACALLEKMPLIGAELRARERVAETPAVVRRRRNPFLAFGALGLAAALAFGVAVWWPKSEPAVAVPLEHYATSAGGYERVTLRDGSVLELNANTQIDVQLFPRQRRIALRSGEAHFTVAHDKSRPFIVEAGGVAVRAVGTAFNVRLAQAGVEVLVTEGRVALAESEGAKPANENSPANLPAPAKFPAAELEAGQRVLIAAGVSAPGPAAQVEQVEPAAIRQALSWQERQLVFSETPLRDVVVQFNRHNRIQLSLDNAELGDKLVGGTFAADNVATFVRLLESSGEIVAEPKGELEIVLHKAR